MREMNIFRKKLKTLLIFSAFILLILSFSAAQEQSKNSPTYENKELGVKITGPEGWSVKSEEASPSSFYVIFSPYPFTSSSECIISLMAGPQTLRKFKTPLDVAFEQISFFQTIYKDFKIIKEPAIFTLRDQKGVNFIFEGGKDINVEDYKGHLENNMKILAYIFIKNNITYLINCMDTAVNFDNNLKAFETTVNSFVLK